MAGREQVVPGASPIFGGGRVLPSPSQFFLTGEDRLRVVCVNSQPGVVLKVQWRTALFDGTTVPNSETHTPTSDRTAYTDDFELGAGSLLNVTVFASAGSPVIGQTYVIVQLVRGVGAAAIVLGTILAGYITSTQALGFPGSPIVSSTASEPYIRNIVGTDPPAGSEIVETVPTGARWELVSFYAFLNKAAINGGPMELRKYSGADQYWAIVTTHTHNAGAAINYHFAQGLNTSTAGPPASGSSNHAVPLNAQFAAGDTIKTSLVNNAGDNWSAPFYTVREWLEVN